MKRPTVIGSGSGSGNNEDPPKAPEPSAPPAGVIRPSAIPASPVPPTAPAAPTAPQPSVMRPTAFPGSLPVQPPATPPKPVRPTVTAMPASPPVPQAPPPAPKPPPPKASAIPAGPATQPVSQKPVPTPHASAPTGIPGKKRERIPVTIEELQMNNLGVKDGILRAAMQLIEQTNIELIKEQDIVMWGNEIQTSYASLVTRCLEFTKAECLAKVTTYVNRMIELLGLIDLKKVSGLEKPAGSGLLGGLFVSEAEKKVIDTPQEMEHALKELGQLNQKMSDRLQELLDLKVEIEAASAEIDASGDKAEAAAIAAQFLADHIQSKYPDKLPLAHRFITRSGSLTQTLTQIRGSDMMRKAQIDHPLHLIEAVQNAANVAMPGWLGSIVSLTTMLRSNQKPTVTEVGELSDQTKAAIAALKGK